MILGPYEGTVRVPPVAGDRMSGDPRWLVGRRLTVAILSGGGRSAVHHRDAGGRRGGLLDTEPTPNIGCASDDAVGVY